MNKKKFFLTESLLVIAIILLIWGIVARSQGVVEFIPTQEVKEIIRFSSESKGNCRKHGETEVLDVVFYGETEVLICIRCVEAWVKKSHFGAEAIDESTLR